MDNNQFEKLNEYSANYSEQGFWDKVSNCTKAIGEGGLRCALNLYYVLQSNKAPAWAKAIVIGALGYLISPIDIVPDIIPVAGLTDDIAVLGAAVGAVGLSIDDEVREKTDRKMREIFS